MSDWRAIVRDHGPMAFQTAWRILGNVHDTEDAVQDAFVAALRAYRDGKISNWGGFLRRAVTCRAIDRLKRSRPRQLVGDETAATEQQPDRRVIQQETAEWLRSVLRRLPSRQAEVFSLRYFAELANHEIATTLGISVDAVAVALHKSRKRIAHEYDLQRAAEHNPRSWSAGPEPFGKED